MEQDRTTREKIIAAVLENSFVKSAEGTSLADIASLVGIKKASLYNHFENRDSIFSAVCAYCGQFMAAKPYIPPDYEATVQKYAAPVVLKGIVRRYLRVYEKGLPLRIYTFVAAEKYFLEDAYAVYRREEEKIVSQMTALFHALKKFGKFDGRFDPAKGAFGSRARWAAMRRTICWRSRTRPAKRAIRNGNLRASSTSTRKSTGSANVPMPVDNESVFPARKNADV